MINDLLDKSTVKRRKAAIALRKGNCSDEICSALMNALKMEESNPHWETQVEIVKTIGVLKCVNSVEYIREYILEKEDEFSLLGMASATAYIRLRRKTLSDVSTVIELINTNSYSIMEGTMEALGYDRMIPSTEDQNIIIERCFNFGKNRDKGYGDPRYGLAAACAGWDSERVKDFLNECLKSKDVPLLYVSENSLKRKYVKLR